MSYNEKFQAELDRCMAEFTELLPPIAARHTSLALLIAIAEHVGGGLRLFMEAGECTPEQAQAVLDRAERIAFRAN